MGSLSTRLDKLEAEMRGRNGRDPPDRPWICRLIYDPHEWQIEEDEAISRMKMDELDQLVAAGKITAIDRERVRFIIRKVVYPPKRPDDPFPEKVVGKCDRSPTLTVPTLIGPSSLSEVNGSL
jgi:hypothetical protein